MNFSALKKNFPTLIFIAIAALLLFSSDAKALLINNLMKIGLFQNNINKHEINETINNPNISFYNVENQQAISLKDLEGKVVFINFWATWCPPCLAEMPSINKLYLKMKDQPNLKFLMVEVDGNIPGSKTLFSKKKYTFPLYTPHSEIPKQILGGSIPTTIILNKKGVMVFRHEGLANYNDKKMIDFLSRKAQE